MAISKTLSQFHQCSVTYNSLSPENIVLTPLEGDYVAKFIDLSDAVICNDEQTFKEMMAVDLTSLGLIFDQLFKAEGGGGEASSAAAAAGGDNAGGLTNSRRVSIVSDGGEEEVSDHNRNVRKRGKQRAPGEGLPLYLGAMISALLINGDDNDASQLRYKSANDVYEDLKAMVAHSSSHHQSSSLKEADFDNDVTIHSRLKSKDLFYGRQVQMSMILHLLQSSTMLGDQPMMALIAGYPGTGKSTLVNQVKKPLADKNGFFIEGKFDVSVRPDKVLASALDSFFASINASNAGQNTYMSMRWRINDAVGSGVSCLFDVIPSLRKFMTDSTEVDRTEGRNIGGNLMGQRLKYMFCKLIGAISCRSTPLVLVLDDLQWADKMTLEVIRMLMIDPDIHYFLFLGCYRENEVNESHMLSANLNDIREQGINFMTIKVGAIEKESVNALISDVLCLPPSLCRPLSTVVHQKTGGIIMFVRRLLISLNDEGLVWYSLSSHRWMFDLQKIEVKEMSEDVVKHMTEHMSRLPKKMQMGLKLCACLGPKFDTAIVEKVQRGANIGDNFLESCVDDGFLQIKGDSGFYTWAHDQVQQAAYELIPLQQREKFHLLIGSRLFLSTSSAEIDKFIFYIVDNMNRGVTLVDNPQQKYEMAELNLRAGEKILERHSFQSSVKYLMAGIALLENDSWEKKYGLTIRLHDAASEALCATGDFPKLTALAEKPLIYARCFQDKLNIYNNLVRALSSSGENEECISRCVSVLSQLGEFLPKHITPDIYREEVAKVKQALIGQSKQDLLSLPVMTEAKKLTAMRFLNHMLIATYSTNPPLNLLVVFRMVRMTVDFGVCNISAVGFACYGAWLASSPNDEYEGAFTMGRVASDLMKKLCGAEAEILPRIYLLIYGMINIYKEPWQASLCKYSEAFDAGMISGDTEYALSNITLYYMLSLFNCGSNLKETSQSLHKFVKRALQYQHQTAARTLAISEQMAYDLMGLKKNCYEAHFGLDEEALKNFFVRNKLANMARNLYQKIKYVTYMCGDMDAAAKHYDLQEELNANCSVQATTGRTSFFFISTFIDGLIGLYFARKHREDEAKWTHVAEKAIELMKKWTDSSSWNCANKLYLLQAEYFFLQNDERAYACYRASITKAREHKFNHEEGLAHEKLATYLLYKNQHDEALQHFQNAKKCYATWGANVLVQRVEKAITILSPLCVGSI
eukprot:scaffold21542_cov121-Skeletonema_dohrnii-CCMP3373.AAC.2